MKKSGWILCAWSTTLFASCTGPGHGDPLPSWNDGRTKATILAYVDEVTAEGTQDYVPPSGRIAVFDNDGTLWGEQPMYFQLLFAIDRVRELAPEHPEWRERQPFQGVLEGDLEAALAGGEKAVLELVMATHAGMTTEEFEEEATAWLATARHPSTDRPYTEMVYQPMLELLDYLRANGFKTFIVSGGGLDFLRLFAEEVYGIPPEQVVGSRIAVSYQVVDGVPELVRASELAFVDDKEEKPVAIHEHIGRRPIAAFGNSDGDFQMLEWTAAGPGKALCVLVHHDDAVREWAYDRDSHIGRLARGLDEGPDRGWILISMKDDWAGVFPAETP